MAILDYENESSGAAPKQLSKPPNVQYCFSISFTLPRIGLPVANTDNDKKSRRGMQRNSNRPRRQNKRDDRNARVIRIILNHETKFAAHVEHHGILTKDLPINAL